MEKHIQSHLLGFEALGGCSGQLMRTGLLVACKVGVILRMGREALIASGLP
jgi:hypothetical protein